MLQSPAQYSDHALGEAIEVQASGQDLGFSDSLQPWANTRGESQSGSHITQLLHMEQINTTEPIK